MYLLALCYLNGDGVAKDESQGLKWLKTAAKAGKKDARDLLKQLSNE